jgi:hypothetical protein
MSSGKAAGHATSDTDWIGAEIVAAMFSSAVDAAVAADARTLATSDASASSSRGSPDW